MNNQPPIYDVDNALRVMQRCRAQRDDPLTQMSAAIGARLASHIARHFPNGTGDAGTALIVAAASVGHLQELPVPVVVNVIAFAGARLLEPANTDNS